MKIDNKTYLDVVNSAPELYKPSPFWVELGLKQIEELRIGGFENFKRTINMKYFNWNVFGILVHQLLPVFLYWIKNPDIKVLFSGFKNYKSTNKKIIKSFNFGSAWLYKVYVCMLYNFVKKDDKFNLLRTIKEPLLGNPFVIDYDNIVTSQDLCNSVHEFYSADGIALYDGMSKDVMELGAGYGRLGYVYLSAISDSTYSVIDIPPALFVSQEYLTQVFPDVKVFKYREFDSYDQIKSEFESSRIRFLASHQIELLPNKIFDVGLNISSLHEMTKEQIEKYFYHINRLCKKGFYTKQWINSRAMINGFRIGRDDYPVPKGWKTKFHRNHPIQKMFFDAYYFIN